MITINLTEEIKKQYIDMFDSEINYIDTLHKYFSDKYEELCKNKPEFVSSKMYCDYVTVPCDDLFSFLETIIDRDDYIKRYKEIFTGIGVTTISLSEDELLELKLGSTRIRTRIDEVYAYAIESIKNYKEYVK